uniref:Uncharacterized protein n=1 Tax=Globodera rostochiensis TaxID=31243 RepID=A0A914HWE6_GLORO
MDGEGQSWSMILGAEMLIWTQRKEADSADHRPLLDKYLAIYTSDLLAKGLYRESVDALRKYGTSTRKQIMDICAPKCSVLRFHAKGMQLPLFGFVLIYPMMLAIQATTFAEYIVQGFGLRELLPDDSLEQIVFKKLVRLSHLVARFQIFYFFLLYSSMLDLIGVFFWWLIFGGMALLLLYAVIYFLLFLLLIDVLYFIVVHQPELGVIALVVGLIIAGTRVPWTRRSLRGIRRAIWRQAHDMFRFFFLILIFGTPISAQTGRTTGWRPERTVVFCAWDAEEDGLIGPVSTVPTLYRAAVDGALIVRDWKPDVVYLVQFPRTHIVPIPSPFALKLETWLRINGNVDNEFKKTSSKGQIPFIELHGCQFADSNLHIRTRIVPIVYRTHRRVTFQMPPIRPKH